MNTCTERAPTTGTIAERLQVPLSKVEYVIRSRSIQPRTRAGAIRVFSEEAIAVIAEELKRIQERREVRHER